MLFHAIAVLPGDRRKSIVNKTDDQILAEVVIPFVSTGVVSARWGKKVQSYQVLELRIYQTEKAWHKKSGVTLDGFIGKKKNLFPKFEQKARQALGSTKNRVFVIMPIQGEKFGSQDEQRVYREYDERFQAIESALAGECVSIRIDKEHPLDDLVARIKNEIGRARFVVADLTDERPSCYFEAGYAEALRKPVIYIASKESVLRPGTETKIHFDVHMSVNLFVNHSQLREKLLEAVAKNRTVLFADEAAPAVMPSPGGS